MKLPQNLLFEYHLRKNDIRKRLDDFKNVAPQDYFYEACYCLLTPQSKAKNADAVVKKLIEIDFRNKRQKITDILNNKLHYIRFHNTKAQRLLDLANNYEQIEEIIFSNISNFDKRNSISKAVKGYGLKEASHFLRNIGYSNLAILDRHILKNLVKVGVINEIPKISSEKIYFKIENEFLKFANEVNIPIDELDLLFWSIENGEILK